MSIQRLGGITFIVGLILCFLFAFISTPALWITITLLLLGFVVGFLNIKDKDTNQFLLASIVLIATSATPVGDLPAIGAFLSRVVTNFASFVGPAALIVSIFVVIKIAHSK
ncbi:MAG: hypothetical protein WCX82_01070 [archaeon]|jgi:hypothetical protein